MDQKQVKERLKSARDFMKNKQFAEACKVCEDVLTHDAKNYNALIFRGAALVGLQRIADALDSYRQATRADPDQILGWQGISSVYEKHAASIVSADQSEIIGCYEKLFGLVSSDKALEIGSKLSEAYSTGGEHIKALSTCERLMSLDSWKTADERTRLSIWRTLCSSLPLASEKPDPGLLEKACRGVIESPDSVPGERSRCWDQLIRNAAKNSEDVDGIWRLCLESIEQMDDPVFPLELMCRIYLDSALTRPEPYDPTIATVRLGSVSPGSAWLQLLEGYGSFVKGDRNAAESVIREGLKRIDDSVAGLFCQAECLISAHRVEEARATLRRVDVLLGGEGGGRFFGRRQKMEELVRLCRVRVLLEDPMGERGKEALELCQQLTASDPNRMEFKLCLCRTLLNLADFESAKKVIDDVLQFPSTAESLLVHGIYLFLLGKMDEAMQRFKDAIEANPSCALGHYYLGVIHFRRLHLDDDGSRGGTEDGEKDKEGLETTCLQHLLQAAKLDPYFSKTFVHLGHFHRYVLHDSGKATRCYQKAFELDNDNHEAGAGLVDCLLANDEKDSALRILTSISSKANSPKWSWMRLGLHQMRYGDATDAIRSFQTAVKRDPKDARCWECLGDAFVNRGSYSSAVKVFTKVTELAPDDLYGFYQVAALKLKLGLYAEAVDQYRSILDRSPDYIPALQGLGAAYLEQSRRDLGQLLYGRAIGRCQDAIAHLARAAKMRPEMSCLWKQLGDACTMLHVVPSQLLSINVPVELLKSESIESVQLLTKKELLQLGARCYGMALKLQPDMSSLWHDLGVNFHAQTKVVEKVMSKVVAIKSLQALRKAVTLDPSNHLHWIALGVVATSKELSDPGLAQHCFIKSVQAEPNNVVAWTNLGTLYLINNQLKLAHEAFKVAQSLEPSYANSWIGQAFIAESLGDHDTMDLFRHTTELSDNLESCIGYAHWVCLTLKDSSNLSSKKWYKYAIEHLNAVTAAGDAMSKYTDCVPDDVVAWNIFSLLLEQQNLFRSALNAIERALQPLASPGVAEDSNVALGVRENYARLLCKNGRYDESVKAYQTLPLEKSFDVASGLGLAFLKAGQPDKSIEMYEKALGLTSQSTEQNLVRVALGIATLATKDIEETKTHLFHSIHSSPPSMDGLKALLFVAYIQRDPSLMRAVMQKIQQTITTNCLPHDLTILTAYIRLRLVSAKAAALDLVKSVHLRPQLTENWTQLAKFILMAQPDGHAMAGCCSRVAVAGDTRHRLDALLCLGLASLPAASSTNHDAYRAAQKAVHLRPDALSSWCLLLAASHLETEIGALAGKRNEELRAFSISVAERLLAQIETELRIGRMHKGMLQLLRKWSATQYALALLSDDRMELASKFIEQAAWYYDDDPIFRGLSAYFSPDQSLKQIVQEQPGTSLCQIHLAWLLNNGSLADAHNCYKTWLKESSLGRSTALGADVRSRVSKCLFELHAQAGNESELRELLTFAKKAKDQELIRMYDDRKSFN